MFSDMEGFTSITERLGDREAYNKVIQDHHRIVREQLAAHGGHELELQGDGFLLAFPRPPAGCGARCHPSRLRRDSAAASQQPIRVRIGLHTAKRSKTATSSSAAPLSSPPASRHRQTGGQGHPRSEWGESRHAAPSMLRFNEGRMSSSRVSPSRNASTERSGSRH